MTNKEIANTFKLLADLMEMHGENPFKIKSYANAYLALKKYDKDLNHAFSHEIESIPGIGKAVVEKINELLNTDKMGTLEDFLKKTPDGIVQMLQIRGLGPKKVKSIWTELKIEDVSELLLACNENRLVEVKGFGLKTQDDIKNKIEFHYSNSGKYHFASLADAASECLDILRKNHPNESFEIVGLLRRKMPIVDGIELLSSIDKAIVIDVLNLAEEDGALSFKNFPLNIIVSNKNRFGNIIFETSSNPLFIEASSYNSAVDYTAEEALFQDLGIGFCPSAYRESVAAYEIYKSFPNHKLIEIKDIRGVVHNHSTYSDGLHSLSEMANACQKKGYEYLVISDHSVSAFYAKGMNIERVQQQWREIDELNKTYANFKIYKGIESDILSDGRLDYPEDILAGFDVVIASIHSNLNMDEEKATKRLITAIENKYTDILGHPTGRLLLGRKGYDIDFKKVIDACASNGVVIELNANPQRLDLDWQWIPYALEKNVNISINPDAHSVGQIDYIKYGVYASNKGGLTKDQCLNASTLSEFEVWVNRN